MTETPGHPGLYGGMRPCYWGSVNQWECDENNHMNVRFYAHKMNQAIAILVSRISNASVTEVQAAVRRQHIRFLSESRAATPLRVDAAVTASRERQLEVVSLMHDNVTGRLLAAFQTTLDAGNWRLSSTAVSAPKVPESAQPRGIDPAALPTPPASVEQAQAAGYRVVGRGIIEPAECGQDGSLLPHAYVGRISDGMPNLWAHLNPPEETAARSSGAVGGAALEQHLRILAPLRTGSVFTQLSGVRAIGNKTQQMAHLVYDETGQRFAAVSEAVGVAMDLTTRKAVPISPERRRHLEGLLLK